MALTGGYAFGAIQWQSADPATTTYVVSGLGFTPKFLRVYWTGIASAVDADSTTLNERRGIGFAASPSSRRCVATEDQDNVATTVCTSAVFTDCLAATVTATGPARNGALDLQSFDSDGFTLVVDDAAPVDITVSYEVWGGDDITDVTVGDIAEPAATGNQDYAATGFTTRGNNQILMFAGCQATALDTPVRTDSGVMVGAASAPTTAEQAVVAVNSHDNVTTSDTRRANRVGSCLLNFEVGGAGLNVEATLSTWLDAQFRLNWTLRGLTNRRYIYAAIKGAHWRVGAMQINGNAVGNISTIDGLPFTPTGLSVFSHGRSNTPTFGFDSVLANGSATSGAAQQSQSSTSDNNSADGSISLSIQYDVLLTVVAFGTAHFDWGLTSIDPKGFTINWIGPETTDTQWAAYVAYAPLKKFLLH